MFYDRAQIAGTARITKDGYFVADALVARADNIQDYLASELGLTDRGPTDIVRVFRPAAEVFHKDALASLAHRPVTLDHPADPVQASNWKDHAVGDVGDEVMRDGEFVRVPIKVMDAKAIASIKSDRREFSLGYTAEMTPESGVHDGQSYDYVARNFRYNHLAAVARARGGESLRIIDERSTNQETTMKIKIGDAEVDATNGEAVRIAVDALNTKMADGVKALADAQTAHDKALAAKDTEIDDLKTKVVDQDKIDALADAKADAVTKAKALLGDKAPDFAGKGVADVRRETVRLIKGDAAVADKSDDYIDARFDGLTEGKTEATDTRTVQPIGTPRVLATDNASVRDAARMAQYA